MGGSTRNILAAVNPVSAAATVFSFEGGKRAATGQPVLGQDVKDPTGAKRAAAAAQREQRRQEERANQRETEIKEKEETELKERHAVAGGRTAALARRRASTRKRSTILTSPLGIPGESDTSRRTLLGA